MTRTTLQTGTHTNFKQVWVPSFPLC